jgi:hypothetical protein
LVLEHAGRYSRWSLRSSLLESRKGRMLVSIIVSVWMGLAAIVATAPIEPGMKDEVVGEFFLALSACI